MKHKEQRVLVLFDVQNLYYSAKHYYNTKVNFKEILNSAIAGRKLIRAIAYVIKTEIKDEVNFHEALNKMGIEVKAKDIQIFMAAPRKVTGTLALQWTLYAWQIRLILLSL